MSGIGIVVAAGGGAAAVQPLTVSISWNGDNPYYQASGASGVCSPYSVGGTFYPNIIVTGVQGGTQPYTINYTLSNNTSGKIGIGPDASGQHTTLNWSGFSLNEIESVSVSVSVTDSVGAHASASIAGSLLIKRVS